MDLFNLRKSALLEWIFRKTKSAPIEAPREDIQKELLRRLPVPKNHVPVCFGRTIDGKYLILLHRPKKAEAHDYRSYGIKFAEPSTNLMGIEIHGIVWNKWTVSFITGFGRFNFPIYDNEDPSFDCWPIDTIYRRRKQTKKQ